MHSRQKRVKKFPDYRSFRNLRPDIDNFERVLKIKNFLILQTLKNVFAEKPKQLFNPDTLLTLKYGETCPDFSTKLAVFDCFGKCPKHQIIIHFESLRCLN